MNSSLTPDTLAGQRRRRERATVDRARTGRPATLLAERVDDGHRFDIRIQGRGETVVFDV